MVKLRNINKEANFAVKPPKSHIISSDLSSILKRERKREKERARGRLLLTMGHQIEQQKVAVHFYEVHGGNNLKNAGEASAMCSLAQQR